MNTEEFFKAVEADRERVLSNHLKKLDGLSLDKEQRESIEEGVKEMYQRAEYTQIDNSKTIATSKCKHNWYSDEALSNGNKHWVCSSCGLGRYSMHQP